MEHENEVSAELHRLADTEHFDPLDTDRLLTRGRRGRRRRTLLTITGTVAGVAAIAVAATVLPGLASADKKPPVAADTSKPLNSQFGPVPGVPRGEDGAAQRITLAEANRRCALRTPKVTLGSAKVQLRSGRTITDFERRTAGPSTCIVPGGDKPSAALVAAAKADPYPRTAAGQLRNCSVRAWIDMTHWKVVVSDRLDLQGFNRVQLIAVSPSGRTAVACQLTPTADFLPVGFGWGIFALKLDDLGTDYPRLEWPDGTFGKDLATIVPEGTDCNGPVCGKSLPSGWGRAPANTARIVVQVGSGPKYEAPLADGWFTFTALDKTPHSIKDKLTVRAYDASGKLLAKLYPER